MRKHTRAPRLHMRMKSLQKHVKSFGGGWDAVIVTGKSLIVPGAKKLIIKRDKEVKFTLDLSQGDQTINAIRWIDREFGTKLEESLKVRHARRLHGTAPKCSDIALCLKDERGLTLKIRTKAGDEMTLTGCVEIDVSRG